MQYYTEFFLPQYHAFWLIYIPRCFSLRMFSSVVPTLPFRLVCKHPHAVIMLLPISTSQWGGGRWGVGVCGQTTEVFLGTEEWTLTIQKTLMDTLKSGLTSFL